MRVGAGRAAEENKRGKRIDGIGGGTHDGTELHGKEKPQVARGSYSW